MPVNLPPLPAFLDLLSAGDRADALAVATTLTVTKGTVLFRTGDDADGLYELVEGKVKLSRFPGDMPGLPVDGHESIMRLVSPGQLFGEIATFDGGPRNETAVAVTAAVIRHYPPAELDTLIRGHVEIGRALIMHVTRRLRFSLDRTADLQTHDSSVRLGKVITLLALRFGERNADGLVIQHDLTQAEIGGLSGLSRETVSKLLADLAARGVIRCTPGRIVVLDEQALRDVVGTIA